jgi:4-methylaminobutanoate oxidase (formaldehyde-forming)
MDVPIGKIVYTQILNQKGGIESDLTVSRLTKTTFLLVVPCATLQRDLKLLKRFTKLRKVAVVDVSASEGVLSIMGPNSRQLLSKVSPNDFSNESHPFGTWKDIEIGFGVARAHRVSYVGELGWEIYISSDQCAHVFEEIWKIRDQVDFRLCGLHTLDSCRIEKAYRHFGHDITDEDHLIEAGLGFTADISKDDFLGKQAILEKKDHGVNRLMLQFLLDDPSRMVYHNEPIIREDKIVGYLTSGNYGHFLGAGVGLGYVDCKGLTEKQILNFSYSIDVAGKVVPAKASIKPMYDPKSIRVRM